MSEGQDSGLAVPSQPKKPSYRDDEIDVRELWGVLVEERWLIVWITSFFAITSIIISIMLPNIYRSEALLAPASESEQASLTRLAGQFGGLAGLAGVSLGGASLDKTTLSLEIVKSRAFITQFIEKHQIQVPLMASVGWDFKAREWIIDETIYDVDKRKWIKEYETRQGPGPSALEMHRVFLERLSVSRANDTGLVTMSLESQSPEEARRWLSLLIKDLNEYMRKGDIDEANANIAYLTDQLKRTSVAEMQKIFYQLVEQQTKTVMLAEAKDEYVFKVIDPPQIPEQKAKPKRMLIVVLATMMGCGVGLILAVLWRGFS